MLFNVFLKFFFFAFIVAQLLRLKVEDDTDIVLKIIFVEK